MVFYTASFIEILLQEVCLAGIGGPSHDLCDRVFKTGTRICSVSQTFLFIYSKYIYIKKVKEDENILARIIVQNLMYWVSSQWKPLAWNLNGF